jgi:2-iminobutanoate/2-iminopropanoate deaminase
MSIKEVIISKEAPAPIGPYSQAIKANGFIFTSGQIGFNTSKGILVQDSIENETRQVLENVKTILASAGSSISEVVKVTVFITNMKNFQMMNSVYAQYFPENPPARSCVEVGALPGGARVEIETIATCEG